MSNTYTRTGTSGNYTYTYGYDNATTVTNGRSIYSVSGETFNGDVYIESNVTVNFTNCTFYGSVIAADGGVANFIAGADNTTNNALYTADGGFSRITSSSNVSQSQ